MRVLILEDDEDIAASLTEGLVHLDHRYEVRCTSRLSEAEALLREEKLDVALIDLKLPDADGCDVAVALREIAPELPLVALTGKEFDDIALDLARYGVQDYLSKGRTTLSRVHEVLQLAVVRHQRESFLRRQACVDALTGALNRSELEKQLVKAISHADRMERAAALMVLDVDDFKRINDTHGHPVGDAVLVELVRRLKSITRSGDSVGRLGGDEFALVLEGLTDEADATAAAEKASSTTRFEMRVGGQPVNVSTSIGVIVFPQQASPRTLLERADNAMYRAKRSGKGMFAFYLPDAPSE